MLPLWLMQLIFVLIANGIKLGLADDTLLTTQSHPCQRQCRDNAPQVCYYKFHLEWYYTLSRACHGCPFNQTDCFRPHCIPGNGVQKAVTIVNRQLPGPSIQVCEDDTLIIDVQNLLGSESTTIHWHGLHQKGSPYMDGVPMITQCPIQPHTTFRYAFKAVNPGTHFWHSHTGMQSADGAHGTLIIRQTSSKDPHSDLFDEDLPEHVFIITDWLNVVGMEKFAAHHHSYGDNKAPSFLINGRGRYKEFINRTDGSTIYTPLQVFRVRQGIRYRFRVVSNGVLNCPVQLSIDNHLLKVIASDGSPLEPVDVESLVVYSGERFDFVVAANQDVGNFWMKVRGLLDCGINFTKAFQVAIFRYEGAAKEDPKGIVDYEHMDREGMQLNSLNSPNSNTSLSIADIRSLSTDDWLENVEPDVRFHLAFDFNAVDNDRFHHPQLYPFHETTQNNRFLYTPQINGISLAVPSSPLLLQSNREIEQTFCNETSIRKNCSAEYCECLYVLRIPLNSVVELILIDKGYTFDANHPFHLHGHTFRVIAMHRVASQVSLEEVKKLDAQKNISRNFNRPPIKDSITVPDGGYTIVRFLANNPGYWLLHCHITFHMELGMAVVFKVGENSDISSKPKNFPECGDWVPNVGFERNNAAKLLKINPVTTAIMELDLSSILASCFLIFCI